MSPLPSFMSLANSSLFFFICSLSLSLSLTHLRLALKLTFQGVLSWIDFYTRTVDRVRVLKFFLCLFACIWMFLWVHSPLSAWKVSQRVFCCYFSCWVRIPLLLLLQSSRIFSRNWNSFSFLVDQLFYYNLGCYWCRWRERERERETVLLVVLLAKFTCWRVKLMTWTSKTSLQDESQGHRLRPNFEHLDNCSLSLSLSLSLFFTLFAYRIKD